VRGLTLDGAAQATEAEKVDSEGPDDFTEQEEEVKL
jgi:hypothetical protein